jgi:hypothetical protein
VNQLLSSENSRRCLVLIVLCLSVVGTSFASGCGEDAAGPEDDAVIGVDTGGDASAGLPVDRNFAAPEGVIAAGDRVFVANANFAYQGSSLQYGTGFVTVVDADGAAVMNRIPLPFRNPQEVAVADGTIWVLCSGETTWDPEESTVVVRTSGGLAGIDIASADTAAGPSRVIPIPTEAGSFVGYPSGLMIRGETAWVASGTTAALFKVDLASGVVERGADDPVMLASEAGQNTTAIGSGPGNLMVAGLFNDDLVMLVDPETMNAVDSPWASAEVGQPGQLDGILDIESDGQWVYLLFGLANQIARFDAATGPAGGVTRVAGNLMTPNRMKLSGGELFVVNSGDNSLASIALSDGTFDAGRVALPVGCNPWDLDVEDRGGSRRVWVSCIRNDRLVRVDLADSSLTVVE